MSDNQKDELELDINGEESNTENTTPNPETEDLLLEDSIENSVETTTEDATLDAVTEDDSYNDTTEDVVEDTKTGDAMENEIKFSYAEEKEDDINEDKVNKYSPLMEPDQNNKKKGMLFIACIGAAVVLVICICFLLLRDGGKDTGNDKTTTAESGNDTNKADNTNNTENNDETNSNEVTTTPEVTEAVSYPPVEVVLGDYKGLSVSVLPVEVSDEDVQAELDLLLSSNQVLEPITDRDEVQSGDVVTIDYVGTMDGVEFEGGSAEGSELEIGSGAFIPGFEDQIIGHKVGEEFDITVTFPEDYQAEMAGKEAVFHINLHSIGKYATAEATDEFIAANTGFATLEEYKEGTYNALLENAQATSDSQKEMDLVTKAIENATFNGLSEEEVKAKEAEMIAYYESYASYSGMDLATFVYYYFGMDEATFNLEIAKAAESQVKQNYLLDKIIEVEEIKLTDQDYTDGATEYATEYGYATVEEFETYYGKEAIESSLLYDRALDVIVNSAIITTE